MDVRNCLRFQGKKVDFATVTVQAFSEFMFQM